MKKIAVVGGGVGGLTVCARLAQAGFAVDLFDAAPQFGGKMYQYSNSDGLSWDTGPTLVTLPQEIKNTFCELNAEAPELLPLSEGCRLVFSDGTDWSLPQGHKELVSFFEKINPISSKEIDKILKTAKNIFEFAENHVFHSDNLSFLALGLKSFQSGLIFKHPFITVLPYEKMIDTLLTDVNLKEFFYHFSSYVGVTPSLAQSGILAIAHVELNSQIVFPKGGVYSIAKRLQAIALEYKAKLYSNSKVISAKPKGDKHAALGWELNIKENDHIKTSHYDLIISNCDPFVAAQEWIDSEYIRNYFLSKIKKNTARASESQFVILFDWENHTELSHHVKIFPKSWRASFEDVCDKKIIPVDPCVYLVWPHATDKSVSPRILFISAMAPNTQSGIKWNNEFSLIYANKILNICKEKLNINFKGNIFKTVTPDELAIRSNAFYGGIYSAGSTNFDPTAFLFSGIPNQVKNLYFVGAGVHPGAGVCMVMKSARRIANHIISKEVKK